MKRVMFCLAFMLVGSFAFANPAVAPKAQTAVIFSQEEEKTVTYVVEHPIFGKTLVTVPVGAFGSATYRSFPVHFNIYGNSGSFQMGVGPETTMQDIMDVILALFF